VDLEEDEPYQVVETESMTRDDYDRILREGWPQFYSTFIREKVFDGVPPEVLPLNQPPIDVRAEWAKLGVPVLRAQATAPPLEFLCGGRSLTAFALDLVEIPDKIEAVMDEIVPYLSAPLCQQAKLEGYPAIWIGGWRAAPPMLSPEMWGRFVWPYFRRLVYEVIEHGLIPILHLDSKWDRELARFRELPKGKVIMALDGETDIFKAKEVLGDHLCIMGDVPPSMLCFDDAERVFEYSTRLIRELGPEGFILHSGCDIPENAKLENVQAMVAASLDT
jgi:uroporphyrinogen-III decarboxylase